MFVILCRRILVKQFPKNISTKKRAKMLITYLALLIIMYCVSLSLLLPDAISNFRLPVRLNKYGGVQKMYKFSAERNSS